MIAAFIGLLGVIAGAFVTGIVDLRLERTRRRKSARLAAVLITNELHTVERRIASALKAGAWWTGDLPNEQWAKHVEELGAVLDPRLLTRVVAAQVIVDRINSDRPALLPKRDTRRRPHERQVALTDHERKLLTADMNNIRSASAALEAATPRLTGSRLAMALRRLPLALATVIVAGAAVTVGILAVFSQQPDLRESAISATVQQMIGPSALVDCDPQGADWSCLEYSLDEVRSRCLATQPAAAAAGRNTLTEIVTSTAACHITNKPTKLAAEVLDGKVVVTPGEVERGPAGEVTPGEVERGAAGEVTSAELPRSSRLMGFLRWVTGG